MWTQTQIDQASAALMYWTKFSAVQMLLILFKSFDQLPFTWWVILSPIWFWLLAEVMFFPVALFCGLLMNRNT